MAGRDADGKKRPPTCGGDGRHGSHINHDVLAVVSSARTFFLVPAPVPIDTDTP